MYTSKQYTHKTADKFTTALNDRLTTTAQPVTREIDWNTPATSMVWYTWQGDLEVKLDELVGREQRRAFVKGLPTREPRAVCQFLYVAIEANSTTTTPEQYGALQEWAAEFFTPTEDDDCEPEYMQYGVLPY